jgi:hypothetical protein
VNRRIRTCYIASPPGLDLRHLRASLIERGINVIFPDDFSLGVNLSAESSGSIAEADLVIGVLTRERRSQWILFELGQASAMGRQIVLIAPPKLNPIPSNLPGFLVLRINLQNRDAIDFALDQLLAAPSPSIVQPVRRRTSQGLGAKADDLLRDYRVAMSSNDAQGLERIVLQALRGPDVVVIAESPASDRRVDLAIWSDPLQQFVGNPLLVEIKSRITGLADARRVAEQLSSASFTAGTGWALLLYGEGPAEHELASKALPPTILTHSIPALLEEMRDRSFVDIVKDLRNRRVHGENR